MSTSTRVTLDRYHAMTRRGEFEPRDGHRVELIRGETVPMSPIGPPHHNTVTEPTERSYEFLPPRAVRVVVQGATTIPHLESEPEPNIVWARRGDSSARHPRPEDLLLVIQVADSSLATDRGLKARRYTEAGVTDSWVVNLPGRCVEVRRDPLGKEYRPVEVFRPGAEVRPLAFPGVALAVERIFPA